MSYKISMDYFKFESTSMYTTYSIYTIFKIGFVV